MGIYQHPEAKIFLEHGKKLVRQKSPAVNHRQFQRQRTTVRKRPEPFSRPFGTFWKPYGTSIFLESYCLHNSLLEASLEHVFYSLEHTPRTPPPAQRSTVPPSRWAMLLGDFLNYPFFFTSIIEVKMNCLRKRLPIIQQSVHVLFQLPPI